MVYETDFYTVRRPYTRPTITSYSVTGCRPMVWKTTTISPLGAQSKVRLSVLLGELNRIQNRPRMHLSYVPTEDFLNSRPLVAFDDETKYIRAEADKLMKYIYVPVPHQRSRVPPKITTGYDRITGNGINPYRYGSGISNDILNMSYYYEPTRATIGRGHLACVTFAGGRGYPRRKHLFADENRDIRDEIKVRSYYNKHVNPSTRVDESLALPTGFAARLLLSDRKPISQTEEEKKSIKPSRFRKTISEDLSEKIEKTTEKWLDPVFTDKLTGKISNEESKIKTDIEIPVAKLPSRKKIEDEMVMDTVETGQTFSKIEPVTPPVKEEKVKPKKESRRKMSEKLAESEKISESSKIEKEIPISVKDVEKTISNEVEKTPVALEEQVVKESTPPKRDSVQHEKPLLRSMSRKESKEIEENIPDSALNIDSKQEEIFHEDIIEEKDKNTKSVPVEEPEEQAIDNLKDESIPVQTTEEIGKENVKDTIEESIIDSEVDNKEELLNEDITKEYDQNIESVPVVETEEQINDNLKDESIPVETIEETDKDEIKTNLDDTIEENETEIKENEELKLNLEDDMSKTADEQILETEQVNVKADEETEIEPATVEANEELESSIDITQKTETFNIESEIVLETVVSTKHEQTIEIIEQVDTEKLEDKQEDIINDSAIDIKDNTEPIIEEPLSPEDVNIPQISDEISTIEES